MKKVAIFASIFLIISCISLGGYAVAYAFDMEPEIVYNTRYNKHYSYAPNGNYTYFIELQQDATNMLDNSWFTYKKIDKSATTRIETYNSLKLAHTTAYILNKNGTVAKFEENNASILDSNGYDTLYSQVIATITNPFVYSFKQTQHSGEIVFKDSDGNINNPDIYCYADFYA